MPSPVANSDGNDPTENNDTEMSSEPPIERSVTEPSQELMAPNDENTDTTVTTLSGSDESIDESMEVESSSQATSNDGQSSLGTNIIITNASTDAAAAEEEQKHESTNAASEESGTDTTTMEVDHEENKRDGSNNDNNNTNNNETPIEMTNHDAVDWKRQKRLGETFHAALEKLQEVRDMK